MSPEYRPDTKYKPPSDTTGHLTPPIPPPHVTRPHSDPTLSPEAHAQPSGQRKDQQPPRIKPVVPPGRHLRAHSTPPSPITPANDSSSNAEAVQCSGMTKAGKQCTRQVKVDASMRNIGSGVDVFCFQHAKEVLAPSGFYDRKSGQNFIKFADWIPDYLQPGTQASLRAEMEKARSHTDEPGYIYTFEILDPDETEVIHLKVGRANNLNRRMDQWGKQCGSKEQIVRGWWPGGIVHDEASLMKGTIKAGEKGAWCHRLERLVHLELADLATNTPYLHAGFPGKGKAKATASGSGSTSGNGDGKDKDKGKKGKKDINRCPDCGTAHKEIFSFVRAKKGTYKDKEWDLIVKPVIEKWGAFVEAYL
ncbi:uncharacterized protein STEHIDRAFT_51994 [Stereum hirsutum FP-91666 SS1]|uniref:uncharacterized protein n=1 Tax=Stereum hirsutum (strain FP-91666) TaxID=721885 RepID=UPI0004409F74|nr:uncharacterized protein STEHIDRAFT_51994 [Stereum hirsutum FP-91666 SS1]EIM90304.1 hypothetical protein STEHIDRAFT_51994 [Stereum hirsutum FP-91666 SS1]